MKIRRRPSGNEEKEFLLQEFTKLLFLVERYFDKMELPNNWGLAASKRQAEKDLKLFLKKHGVIKRLKSRKRLI